MWTCRQDWQAQLRVLKRAEEQQLLDIVQRCSEHSISYARPQPVARDVARLARALSLPASSARAAIDQARRARTLLIRFNVRLAASVARKFVKRGMDFPSLMSEATAGLTDAIDRFDRARDCKFTTYAIHYVMRNVRRCVVEEARPSGIQLPPHVHYKLAQLLRMRQEMLATADAPERAVLQSSDSAMTKALAERSGLTEQQVQTLLVSGLPNVDLDRPMFEDSGPEDWLDHIVESNEVRMPSQKHCVHCCG